MNHDKKLHKLKTHMLQAPSLYRQLHKNHSINKQIAT